MCLYTKNIKKNVFALIQLHIALKNCESSLKNADAVIITSYDLIENYMETKNKCRKQHEDISEFFDKLTYD